MQKSGGAVDRAHRLRAESAGRAYAFSPNNPGRHQRLNAFSKPSISPPIFHRKGRSGSLILLLLCLLLSSCRAGSERQTFRYTRFAMDTMVEYTIVASSQREAFQAMMAAHDEIERVSSLLWEEDPKSEIRRLNEASGEVELSPEVYEFLARSLEYYRQTSGRFDLSIGPVLKLYPFESEVPVPPSPAEIQAKLAFVGMDRLQFVAPGRVARPDSLLLAVGGVAKGYAVDRAI